jgi:hypothetical protein
MMQDEVACFVHASAELGLRDNTQIKAHHPRAIVIIGWSAEWSEEESRALHDEMDVYIQSLS